MLVAVICPVSSLVSICVQVVMTPSRPEPYSGVTCTAVVFAVTKDTDSCFGVRLIAILATLNPSLLQFHCKELCEPISVFHLSRPR